MSTKLKLNINEAVIARAKIVDAIIKNAPAKKTKARTEKKVLVSTLKKKYSV